MRFEQGAWISRIPDRATTFSHTVQVGLSNTIAQITLADFGTFDANNRVLAETGFIECKTLSASGTTVVEQLGGGEINGSGAVHTFGRNRLLEFTYMVRVQNAFISWVENAFFWESVF